MAEDRGSPEGEGRGLDCPEPSLRKAVFLDRDGTLIEERDYLSDPEDVCLVSGAAEALTLLQDAGFALVVVTNQSGIARGYYSLDDYAAVARRLDELLARHGITLDASLFCPHHPQFTGECHCRKPSTGMHREASERLGLDPSISFFIGDKIRDLLPALELGGEGILVRTGYGQREEGDLSPAFSVADDVLAAAHLILGTNLR
jgi:D-glycero-D-manno-heptose 1,7-bisphosphate phosphatase